MYQILIESTLDDLLIVLLKDFKIISVEKRYQCQKKSHYLPLLFETILNQNQVEIEMIKELYITIGPGSFMGSRASLIFSKTIAQALKAKLFVTDTFTFITNDDQGNYFFNASETQSYQAIFENGQKQIRLTNYHQNTIIDPYRNLFVNTEKLLKKFKIVEDLLTINPIYLKEPGVT